MFQSLKKNKSQVWLGIDYGDVNTGLALSIDGIVSPLKIINSKNFSHFQCEISTIIQKNKINKIIVGLPLSHDGRDSVQSIKVRQVVNNLKKFIKVPFEYTNEYGTTQDFIASGIVSKVSKTTRQKKNDHYSAALILQTYIDSLK